jgi:hypothetical protein
MTKEGNFDEVSTAARRFLGAIKAVRDYRVPEKRVSDIADSDPDELTKFLDNPTEEFISEMKIPSYKRTQ